MTATRTYSKSDAQKRTIVGLFSIMLEQSPREAETLIVSLQRLAANKRSKGNVG